MSTPTLDAATLAAPVRDAALSALEPATYTVVELAQLLKCSERHVWRQLDRGKVPGVIRCGKLVRFSRKIVDGWLSGERRVDRS
jgi:excisionase family DNA binding protein